MRFIGTGARDNEHPAVGPEVVVQLGASKTPLKATQLLGATVRLSRLPDPERHRPTDRDRARDSFEGARNDDEGKALEALSRMHEALSPRQPSAEGGGSWMPWSPDDLYHPSETQRQPCLPFSNTSSDALPPLHREPSDANLPAYYHPAEQPYYVAQHTSASAVRDMALHKGAPTIFDKFGETPNPRNYLHPTHMKTAGPTQRSRTTSGSSKQRKLDLVQLFPQPRTSSGHLLSPSRLQHSPTATTERADFPLPPLPTDPNFRRSRTMSNRPSTSASGGRTGRSKRFEEDIFDQHKTNVRRPPKGIQNWFDAYLSSEDEDNGDEADVDEPEPQELPADEILPPAYSGPTRDMSRRSEKSASGPKSHEDRFHDPHQVVDRPQEPTHLHHTRSSSDSNTSNSIQSSHQGHSRRHIVGESRLASSTLAGESVLSLSESEYDDDEDDEDEFEHEDNGGRNKFPSIRDSIFDDRNITIANASSIDVVRLQRPTQLSTVRSGSHDESKRSPGRLSVIQSRDKPLPVPPPHNASTASLEQAELRRLDGLSLSLQSADTGSSATSFQDLVNSVPSDTAHMMAVTEEEMMLLDLMRRKRAAMQQLSFTEGYQLALKSEQHRVAKRAASAGERALRALKKKEISEPGCRESTVPAASANAPHESDMRRHLSAISKESVDERFQIERFLGMSQPQPLSSHPPESDMPAELPNDRASAELLPPTRYSPATYSPASNPATIATMNSHEVNAGYFSADDCESEAARMRVRQFISTNGAVPPFGTMRTMRRRSIRQTSSVPPSPIAEESIAPPLPPRSPERPASHENSVETLLSRKVSSVSFHDEPVDTSPVSTLMSRSGYLPISIEEQMQQVPAHHNTVYMPSRPGAQPVGHFPKPMPTSPPSKPPRPSPFSNLIQAATSAPRPIPPRVDSVPRAIPRRVDSTQGLPAHLYSQSVDSSIAKRHRDHLPRLDTFDSLMGDEHRGSLLSITSAGEEVLGAWAELGGGRDSLMTKGRTP